MGSGTVAGATVPGRCVMMNGRDDNVILDMSVPVGSTREGIIDGIVRALSQAGVRTLYDDTLPDLLERLLSEVLRGGASDAIERTLFTHARRTEGYVEITVHDGAERNRRYSYLYDSKLSAMTYAANGGAEDPMGVVVRVNIALGI